MIEILDKAQQKALQIFPKRRKYFDDVRRRLLIS